MALLQDLIQQIDDPALRERILQETNKLLKQARISISETERSLSMEMGLYSVCRVPVNPSSVRLQWGRCFFLPMMKS